MAVRVISMTGNIPLANSSCYIAFPSWLGMRFLIPVCSIPCSLASLQTFWFKPSFTNYEYVSYDHVSKGVV